MKILDIQIDNLSRQEILEKVESFLGESKPRTISEDTNNFANSDGEKVRGKFHQIATVNPEFILEAQKDYEFKNILNKSDLNVADGVGIWFAFLRFGKLLKARIAGADLMHESLKMADEKKLSVFLAVNKKGLSSYKETRNALSKKYPNIKFDGADINPTTTNYELQTTNYELFLCNFGAPYQEKFINSLKDAKISVAMGVGGSFDYITGKSKRAPKIMRIFGLEWLWRLIQKSPDRPRRWKRIYNAVIIFPIKIIFLNKIYGIKNKID